LVGRKGNKTSYLVYCNTFVDLHCYRIGGYLMCKYIGRFMGRKANGWVGR
jgi:hypothetical protein